MVKITAKEEKSSLMKGVGILSTRKGLISIIIAVLFIWWLITELSLVSTYRLPRPFSVLIEMFRVPYLIQIWITLEEVFIGFFIGIFAGIAIGTVAAYSEEAQRALGPVTLFFSSIMKSALVSIFVVWFGYGIIPLVLVAALIGFFPVLINTLDGLKFIEPNYLEMMRSIQASRWHIYKKLRFPNALPKIFDGVKVSAVLAVIGAVIGEFLIGVKGIGIMFEVGLAQANSEIVYASILWMAIMGTSLYVMVVLAERFLLPAPLRREEL